MIKDYSKMSLEDMKKKIEKNHTFIHFLKDPPVDLQIDVYKNKRDRVLNPCLEVQIMMNPSLIKTIPSPTPQQYLLAVKEDGMMLEFIPHKDQTYAIKSAALNNSPSSIKFIKKPTEKMWKTALEGNPDVYKMIPAPSPLLKMTYVHTWYNRMSHNELRVIIDPEDDVFKTKLLVERTRMMLEIYGEENISEELKLKAINSFARTITHFKKPSRALIDAALKRDQYCVRSISHFLTPQEKREYVLENPSQANHVETDLTWPEIKKAIENSNNSKYIVALEKFLDDPDHQAYLAANGSISSIKNISHELAKENINEIWRLSNIELCRLLTDEFIDEVYDRITDLRVAEWVFNKSNNNTVRIFLMMKFGST